MLHVWPCSYWTSTHSNLDCEEAPSKDPKSFVRDGAGEWDENGKVDNYILSMNCQHGISDAIKADKAAKDPKLVSQHVCPLTLFLVQLWWIRSNCTQITTGQGRKRTTTKHSWRMKSVWTWNLLGYHPTSKTRLQMAGNTIVNIFRRCTLRFHHSHANFIFTGNTTVPRNQIPSSWSCCFYRAFLQS